MSLVLGVRRVGKVSLLKVFAKMCSYPYIFIDARKLSDYGYSKAGFYRNHRDNVAEKSVIISSAPSPRSSRPQSNLR